MVLTALARAASPALWRLTSNDSLRLSPGTGLFWPTLRMNRPSASSWTFSEPSLPWRYWLYDHSSPDWPTIAVWGNPLKRGSLSSQLVAFGAAPWGGLQLIGPIVP